MFGGWLMALTKDVKPLVLPGIATTCLSIWLSMNNLVFAMKRKKQLLL